MEKSNANAVFHPYLSIENFPGPEKQTTPNQTTSPAQASRTFYRIVQNYKQSNYKIDDQQQSKCGPGHPANKK